MLGSLVISVPVAVMRTKLFWSLMLPSHYTHAAIPLYLVIDIVLLAMSLQAHFVWCFCTPPYLQLQSLIRDIFS